MKYMITGLPSSTPIPREQGAELLQAGLAWIKGKLADGTIESTYNLFGGGGLAIVNADSHEQVLAEILAYPLYPFFDWEVTLLLDFEGSYNEYVNFYQGMIS